MDLCPNCFDSNYKNGCCARCGYKIQYNKKNSQKALMAGTVLHKRYCVGKMLGEGGFGITYKAFDLQKKQICCVKEYAPNGLCLRSEDGLRLETQSRDREAPYRAGLKRFFEESQILSVLEQIPSVVDITDTFQENNTAYFVMEYLDGADLRQIVRVTPRRLPVERVTDIILQVAVSMDVIHTRTKIIHRDISPENIYITRNGKVKLIDFGSAKQTETGMRAGLSVVLKPKFAPPEQYSSEMEQGSFTDVYSLAGTFYYALTGMNIPSAPDRLAGKTYVPLKQMNLGVSDALSDAVDHALILHVNERTRTMQQFIAEVAAGMSPQPKPQSRPQSQARPQPQSQARPQPQSQSRPQPQSQAHPQPQPQARPQPQSRPQSRPMPQPQSRSQHKVPLPYVTVVEGAEKGKNWIIPLNQPMKMGRSETDANLKIRQPASVSRVHCTISYLPADSRFCICDVSANGTYFKGQRLKKGVEYRITPPARFALSGVECVIELGVRYEYR